MARIELAHLEAAAIAGEMGAQIALERGRIEAVALHDGNGIGISGHGRASLRQRGIGGNRAIPQRETQFQKGSAPGARASAATPPGGGEVEDTADYAVEAAEHGPSLAGSILRSRTVRLERLKQKSPTEPARPAARPNPARVAASAAEARTVRAIAGTAMSLSRGPIIAGSMAARFGGAAA